MTLFAVKKSEVAPLLAKVPSGTARVMFVLLAFCTVATAAPLSLSGSVTNAGTFSTAQLQSLGSITETVTIDSITSTYTGVPLWSLLGGTASGTSNVILGSGKNAILRNYIVASGEDGTQSLISLGEINPLFGGTGTPYLVAYAKDGTELSAPELIVPQDSSGTRNVADLANIRVLGVPAPPAGPGGPSSEFTLSGAAGISKTYDLAGLQGPALQPPTTLTGVTFVSGATPTPPTDYTGVPISALLVDAELDLSDILTSYVLATGTDGYQVLFSLAELDPLLGGRPNIIAYADSTNGGTSLGDDGFARVVLSGENRGGRLVSNLSALEIFNAVPLPGTVSLLLPGVVLLLRRKRS